MFSPDSPDKVMPKNEINGEVDSDVTFISNLGMRVKKKKTKKHIHDEVEQQSQNDASILPHMESESESLMRVKKKKHKKQKSPTANGDFDNGLHHVQSQSMLSSTDFSQSLMTDDSQSNDSDKRKKKKIKNDETHHRPKKKIQMNIEFYTQDMFKHPSSEEFPDAISSSSSTKMECKSLDYGGGDVSKNVNGEISNKRPAKLEKNKHKHFESLANKSDVDSIQSLTLLEGINEASYLTDESAIITSDKRKKRKYKSENSDKTNGKSKLKSVDTDDVLEQSIYEESVAKKVKVELPRSPIPEKSEVSNGNRDNKLDIEKTSRTENNSESDSRDKIIADASTDRIKKKKKKRKESVSREVSPAFDTARKVKKNIISKNKADSYINVSNIDYHLDNIFVDGKAKLGLFSPSHSSNSPDFSESTTKVKKNKHKHFKSVAIRSDVENDEAFYLTDDSEIINLDKRKKRKYQSESSNNPNEKSKLKSVDTDDLHEQSIYEESVAKKVKVEPSSPVSETSDFSNCKRQNKLYIEETSRVHDISYSDPQTIVTVDAQTPGMIKEKKPKKCVTREMSPSFDTARKVKKNIISKNKTDSDVNASNHLDSIFACGKAELSRSSPSQSSNLSDSRDSTEEKVDITYNSLDVNIADNSKKSNKAAQPRSGDNRIKISDDIDFKVPRLHELLNRASKPTPAQRETIALENLPVKYGKFSQAEDAQIRENWNYFITVNELEDDPVKYFHLDKNYIVPSSKRIFLYYLARNMPERTPYSVLRRFKLLMGNNKKGRFSVEEDALIKKRIQGNDEKTRVVDLSVALQRAPSAISSRINRIKTTVTRRIKWKSANAAAFIKYLLKVTKIDESDIGELRNRTVTTAEWSKLSRKLDDVPVRTLRRLWLDRLYPGLFIPKNFDIRAAKIQLIKMLYENKETEWRLVNWREYASQFRGFTNLFAYNLVKRMVKSYVPPHKKGNLKKCLKILIKIPEDRIPPRLFIKIKYKNGEVKTIRPVK